MSGSELGISPVSAEILKEFGRVAADLANRLRDFNVGVTPTERKLTGLLWPWQIANRTRLDQVALKLAQRQRGREGWNFGAVCKKKCRK